MVAGSYKTNYKPFTALFIRILGDTRVYRYLLSFEFESINPWQTFGSFCARRTLSALDKGSQASN